MEGASIPNIGARQRRHRLAVGLLAAAASVLALGTLLGTGAPRLSRLLAVLPFWAGVLGVLQHREKT
ncbi:MAG: hypothetical protein AMXMBFR53_21960 [Gemmatimonadota bacterium]